MNIFARGATATAGLLLAVTAGGAVAFTPLPAESSIAQAYADASISDGGEGIAPLASNKGYSLPKPPRGAAPYRWDPCDGPISYVVNVSRASDPDAAMRNIRYALSQVRSATGLKFSYAGATKKIPQASWSSGDYPADMVIAWAGAGQGKGNSDILPGGNTLAMGGWSGYWQQAEGKRKYAVVTHGFVVVDRDATRDIPTGTTEQGGLSLLLMHELAHTMTLRHVDDPAQVLHPALLADRAPTWGPGDEAGLDIVGASHGCVVP